MKRALWILLPPIAFLVIFAVAAKYWLIPEAESWSLKKLRSYSEQNLPVIVSAESLRFHIIKPSVGLEKIQIQTKEGLQNISQGAQIESFKVQLDLFQLLTGRMEISAVIIDSPKGELEVDPLIEKPSKSQELPLNLIFDWLEKIPIERIFVHNINLKVQSTKHKSSAHLTGADLLMNNHQKSLSARVDIPRTQLIVQGQGPVDVRVDLAAALERETLKISHGGIRVGESEVIFRGELQQFQKIMIKPFATLDVRAEIKLKELQTQLRALLGSYKLPEMNGSAVAKTSVNLQGLDQLSGAVEVQTKEINIGGFSLGDASLEGQLKNNNLTFSEVDVHHPAGNAKLLKTELALDRDLAFKTLVKSEHLDLQRLFVSLNLHEVPVWLSVKGDLPCRGQLKTPFKVVCDGHIQGENLLVKSEYGPKGTVITAIDSMSALGQAEITDKAVSYKAKLNLGDSPGESTGVIEYAKGFDIKFKSPGADFKNVRTLANLKFVGSTSIDGWTRGDSHSATFRMNLKSPEFIFEDHYLGQIATTLSYAKGHLRLDDISGLLAKSSYQGNLDVDLTHSQLTGYIRAPTLNLSDIVKVFDLRYHFPLSVDGSGSAVASFSGPFDFWKMSYDLTSQFRSGNIAGERFDQLNLDVHTEKGNLTIQKGQLRKGKSIINVNGGFNNQQITNIKVEGRNFRLDESDFITKLSSSVYGMLNFSSQIQGKIFEPQVTLRGSITETVIDEQEIPSSFFDMKIHKSLYEGNANFFGHRIQADWSIPFANAPFRVRLKTVDWNYASILSILSGSSSQAEYESNMTADIDLHSETGKWQNVSGNILVKNLFLKRGPQSFRNPDPIQVKMDRGLVQIQNFNLEGPHTSIKVNGRDFTFNNMNVNVVANTELRLFHMFFPFLDDLGGAVQLSANITGSLLKPQILGSMSTNNSFVKIKGFPHPIERIQTEVSFSQTKVLINDLRAQMAGGVVSGDGNITLRDYRDFPTNIRLNLDRVNLNLPDKVHSSGSADLTLTGKWFPFTLAGTYRVSSGLFERELTDDSPAGTASIARQSIYLPKVLRQGAFEPLVLDIQIILEKSILVKNSLIDGAVNGNLQIKGFISNPILLGKIQTDRNTKVIFKDTSFDVQTGTVTFNNPTDLNPELYVTAKARVSDYDVQILVQGPAKPTPTIRLSSTPPLAEQDIISLLALGMTTAGMDRDVRSRDQAVQTGYELGFAIFSKDINKPLERTLGVNVQFTTSYDSSRNASVPRISLNKKISDKVNASVSRTVGSDQASSEVKLQYLINNNVSAIGRYEDREGNQGQGNLTNTEQRDDNIFGLDLEFKKEFK